MTVDVIGDYPSLERVSSRIYSLDRAVGNPYSLDWGIPLRSSYEIYGPPESGKSSLSLHLCSVIRPTGIILVAGLEQGDKEYMRGVAQAAGFEGTIEILSNTKKKKLISHSVMLTDAVIRLGTDEDVVAMVLDSVAAVMPPARDDNLIGEGYMTDRARFMNDMTSRVEQKLLNRKTPAVFISVNHVGQSLDPRNRASITPGGKGLKFHSAVRINLWRKEVFPTPGQTEESRTLKGFIAEGTLEKNRFGGRGRRFRVYIVPGRGVHVGMSAMFDAILSTKQAERNTTGQISLMGEKMGRIGTFVNAAFKGDDEKFTPFLEAIESYVPELAGDGEAVPTKAVDDDDLEYTE